MTQPEQGGFDTASQVDLTHLYKIGSIACIRHGEWFDPDLPDILKEAEAPYPYGPFFEISRTRRDIKTDAEQTGNQNLYSLAQKWNVGRITVQYSSDHRRRHGLLPLVETIPGALAVLVEKATLLTDNTVESAYEENFILENRLVNGAWERVTDRLNNRSPVHFFQDSHITFSSEETDELAYFATHLGRIPRLSSR